MNNNNDSAQITIPPEVQELIEAADESGNNALTFTATSVQLLDNVTKGVIKEVQWNCAAEFAGNLLRNTMKSAEDNGLLQKVDAKYTA